MSVFKILIIGDAGVGKSTFVARHRDGDYVEQAPTLGIDVTPLHFSTTRGNITLNVWDMGNGTDHMIEPFNGVHGIILMFDVTRRETYDSLDDWYAKVLEHVGDNIPMVIVGNKIDAPNIDIPSYAIVRGREYHMPPTPIYEVSNKSMYNIDKPFQSLVRDITHDNTLTFI